MTDATICVGAPPPSLRPLRPGETGEELALELGLTRCGECGEFRGTCSDEGEELRLLCICEGIPCRLCKRNLVRRPTSEHFGEAYGSIQHTPWFSGLIPCAECKQEQSR